MRNLFRQLKLAAFSVSFVFPSVAQVVTTVPIPHPLPTLEAATITAGNDNGLEVTGFSSVTSSAFDNQYFTWALFHSSLSSSGSATGAVPLDTGAGYSFGLGGYADRFAWSPAIRFTGNQLIGWTIWREQTTDVASVHIFERPRIHCALVRANGPERIFERESACNVQVAVGGNNRIHLVWQQISPLYPISPSWPVYGPDSNYYYSRSTIEYARIQEDGSVDTTMSPGEGFGPQIHIEKNGTPVILWLRADSSNSTSFDLVACRIFSGGDTSLTILRNAVPAPQRYSPSFIPPTFESFVDDSARVYATWTEGSFYPLGKTFLATLDPAGVVTLDSLEEEGLANPPFFSVSAEGVVRAIWQSQKSTGVQTLRYSRSSPAQRIFASVRTFHSPDSLAAQPRILLNSRGVANCLLGYTQVRGIGYIRDLDQGPDTVHYFSPGSYAVTQMNRFPLSPPTGVTALLDSADRLWLMANAGGLALLMVDQTLDDVAAPAGRVTGFSLDQNYPNPFNPETAISYQLAANSLVTLRVYDFLGRSVATLVNGRQQAGTHTVRFNAGRLASGVYFCRLEAGSSVQVRKMLLLR